MAREKQKAETVRPLPVRVIAAILGWPRITRILIVLVLALVVTLAVSPVVDDIYLRFFFSEQTRIVPSLVTAAIGLTMYFAGWYLLVGTVGEENPINAEVIAYLFIGLMALVLAGIWLVRLITLGNTLFS